MDDREERIYREGLSGAEVARLLGLSRQRVLQVADRIDHLRTPLGRLYDPLAVERFRLEREAA